jgi:hypothetical protein
MAEFLQRRVQSVALKFYTTLKDCLKFQLAFQAL